MICLKKELLKQNTLTEVTNCSKLFVLLFVEADTTECRLSRFCELNKC